MSSWLASAKIVHLSKAIESKPVEPFDPVSQLSTLQQAALLSLYETIPARRCIMKLLEDSQDRYSGSDFAILRDKMLAEFKPGYRLHQITGLGRVAAKDLQTTLCQRFGIHIKQGGNTNLRGSNFYSCCCGQWSSYVERNIHAGSASDVAFAKHVHAMRVAAEALSA